MPIEERVEQLERQNRRLKRGLWLCAVVLLAGGLGAGLFFKAHSDEIARQAQRQDAIARRERDSALRLSVAQELEDLIAEADELRPALPGIVPRYDAWLARAGKLVAGLETSPDGSDMDHASQFELLRQGLLAQQLKLAELQILERKLSWMEQVRAVREGRAEPDVFPLDEALLQSDAGGLNALAWWMVKPGRKAFGREAEGLAMARQALTEVKSQSKIGRFLHSVLGRRDDLSNHHNTLAWALFANGIDTEALAEALAAVAAAPEKRKGAYRRHLQRMARAVETTRGSRGIEALAAVEAEWAALEAEVSALPAWRVADEQVR